MNRRFSLKVISLLVATGILVSLFAACANNEGKKTQQSSSTLAAGDTTAVPPDSDAPGWMEDTSPITFTIYNRDSVPDDWGKDFVSKYIAEKTGVTLEIINGTDGGEKFTVMLASNMLPDIVDLAFWDAELSEMLSSNLLLPLNKLAEQYDPYFFKVADKQKLGWYTKEDNNVYGYPRNSMSPNTEGKQDALVACMVRKDIYEAIGKPDMRTPEGFLKALKDAKEMFPKGLNGQPLVPFGTQEWNPEGGCWSVAGALWQMMGMPMEKDGKYYGASGYVDPEYLTWLKTFRKANEMGLISKEIFTDKTEQIQEKAINGRYFCYMYQWSRFIDTNKELYKTNPDSVYIAVDAFSDSGLNPPRLQGNSISGYMLTSITNKCKNPERAIKWLSYLISEEGQQDLQLGKKGVTWDMTDKGPELLPEYKKMFNEDLDKFNKEFGGGDKYSFVLDPALNTIWKENATADIFDPNLQPKLWARQYAYNWSVYTNLNLKSGSQAEKDWTELARKWGAVQPKLMLAKTEEEMMALYSDFVKEFNRLSPEAIDTYTNQMKENKKKLGIN